MSWYKKIHQNVTTQMSKFLEKKKISVKLNIGEIVSLDLEEFQEKSEEVLVRRQHKSQMSV